MRYDLIVIGSGPSGHHGALAAAKLRKRVALVEGRANGRNGANTLGETIPSKILREAALLLTGFRHRHLYPELFARRKELTIEQLLQLARQAQSIETANFEEQLRQHNVDLFAGQARFVTPHALDVASTTNELTRLEADKILLAVGSKPIRPSWVPFDSQTVFDSDAIPFVDRIPRSMIVVGGGVAGLEYAMIFAVLGTQVTVVDAHPRPLTFCDQEAAELLFETAASYGVSFHLGRPVAAIERTSRHGVVVRLEGSQPLTSESVLYAAGRRGNTGHMNLQAAGLMPDEQGRLWCNDHFQTWVNHIYGVGDVVGFPALASIAMEQGRQAVRHAFGCSGGDRYPTPYGLFTIPELAMVGPTEEQLSRDLIPYEVGVARMRDTSRGHLGGEASGLLKLLFHRETLQLLGVHCVGENATELIHIGQTVMALGGTIEFFRDAIFNDPTLAECYKAAASDALAQLESPAFDHAAHSNPRKPETARPFVVPQKPKLVSQVDDSTIHLSLADEITLTGFTGFSAGRRSRTKSDIRLVTKR